MSVHSAFANCNGYVITNYIGSNIYTFVSALCFNLLVIMSDLQYMNLD